LDSTLALKFKPKKEGNLRITTDHTDLTDSSTD
jgi:hypothetical protein